MKAKPENYLRAGDIVFFNLVRHAMNRSGMGAGRRLKTFFRETSLTFVLLPSLVFLVVPGLIARSNEANLAAIPLRQWLVLVGFVIVSFLLLRGLQSLLEAISGGSRFSRVVDFTCYFVVVTGFLFPLATRTEMVDAANAKLDWGNLVIGVALALLMIGVSNTTYRSHLHLGLAILVGVNAAWVFGVSALAVIGANDGDPYAASSSRNIFVLSFDDLSGSAMREVLEADRAAQNALAGFTVYGGVASSSPATKASIAAELYGNQNFKVEHDSVREVWDSSPQDLITNVLTKHNFEVVTYGTYGTNLVEGIHMPVTDLAQVSASELLYLSIARTLSSQLVPEGKVDDFLRGLLHSSAGGEPYEHEVLGEIVSSESPEWDHVLAASVVDFYEFIDRLHVDRNDPAAFFLHFTHTHWPVEFDERCDFKGDNPAWYSEYQNYEGAIQEATCALKQFSLFIDKVRSLGILEKSMIILKSDHGKPVGYARSGSIESVTIEGHRYHGISRYAPFLAIKPFGSSLEIGGMTLDRSPVLLDDLARTICFEANIDYDCESFPGYNIADPETVISPDAQVSFFVVDSETSDHRYETHEAITLKRGQDLLTNFYEALIDHGKVSEP